MARSHKTTKDEEGAFLKLCFGKNWSKIILGTRQMADPLLFFTADTATTSLEIFERP